MKELKPKVTIVGAGISGLTAAVHLHRQGFSIKIIEASDRAGNADNSKNTY
jgi:phytoene dehydrogenase-like protein